MPGPGGLFWLLGSAGSGNTYNLWDHQNRADPGLGLVVANTANIPSRPQNMVAAAFLEKDLFFNGLLGSKPWSSLSCMPSPKDSQHHATTAIDEQDVVEDEGADGDQNLILLSLHLSLASEAVEAIAAIDPLNH